MPVTRKTKEEAPPIKKGTAKVTVKRSPTPVRKKDWDEEEANEGWTEEDEPGPEAETGGELAPPPLTLPGLRGRAPVAPPPIGVTVRTTTTAAAAAPASATSAPPIITLTSDIGWSYAAQMKGAILQKFPQARVIDVDHEVPSHSVLDGAFLLRYVASKFPAGTVHVAIVDPGVGTQRKPLAARCKDGSVLLGPDNGVLIPLAKSLGGARFYQLDPSAVVGADDLSATFEGRDLFAPAAALIASGVDPARLGVPTQPLVLSLPEPSWTPQGALLTVLHIDRFGNLITNAPGEEFLRRVAGQGSIVEVRSAHRRYRVPVVRTYGDIDVGRGGLLISSFGLVELALNQGRADEWFRIRTLGQLEVAFRRG